MSAPDWYKDVVVVTGTIGSGKSSCVKFFEELGAYCVRADTVAREVVVPGSVGLKKIVEHFGKDILDAGGQLDRKKLGQRVFSNPAARSELESILHPLIHSRVGELFTEAQKKPYPLLVYDCPLLFEAGLDKKGFKSIILVSAPSNLCLDRVMRRDGLSREEAEKRLAAQWPIKQKMQGSDVVIENSGDLSELREKTKTLFTQLI